jgi:hypothetical protein
MFWPTHLGMLAKPWAVRDLFASPLLGHDTRGQTGSRCSPSSRNSSFARCVLNASAERGSTPTHLQAFEVAMKYVSMSALGLLGILFGMLLSIIMNAL